MRHLLLALGILLWLSNSSCEGFWGTKTSTDFLDEPTYDNRQVAYVPIQPVWDGFEYPVDIIAGYDQLIYVADSATEEVISFDQAGNELGRFRVPGLRAIAQDRQLNLYATGTKDTTVNGTDLTLAALYRLDLNKQGPYGLSEARIDTAIVHPFYFRSGNAVLSDEQVSFPGVAVKGDNNLYLARSGPSNVPNQFGGPDDAVLSINFLDGVMQAPSPLRIETELGAFRDYFKMPRSITTLAQPPQSPAVRSDGNFLFTSADPDVSLKVQVIRQEVSEGGIAYRLERLTVGDTAQADGFLYTARRFTQPADVTVAGDRTSYIFVVDAARDSLYQFNRDGFEGVEPPPGSNDEKFIQVSFGGTGQGLTQFDEPRGVAYLSELIYVADAGNGRVLRFRLTTDFE